MKYPRVKDILREYEKNNIDGVKQYLHNSYMVVDPSTWAGKIKRLIDENKKISVMAEIELIINEFKLNRNV